MLNKRYIILFIISNIFIYFGCNKPVNSLPINEEFIQNHLNKIKKLNNENLLFQKIYFKKEQNNIITGFIIQNQVASNELTQYEYEKGEYIPVAKIKLEIEGDANISDFLFSFKELDSLNIKNEFKKSKIKKIHTCEFKKPEEFYQIPNLKIYIQ